MVCIGGGCMCLERRARVPPARRRDLSHHVLMCACADMYRHLHITRARSTALSRRPLPRRAAALHDHCRRRRAEWARLAAQPQSTSHSRDKKKSSTDWAAGPTPLLLRHTTGLAGATAEIIGPLRAGPCRWDARAHDEIAPGIGLSPRVCRATQALVSRCQAARKAASRPPGSSGPR